MDAAVILFVASLATLAGVAGWVLLPTVGTSFLLSMATALTIGAAGLVGFTGLMIWRVSDVIEIAGLQARQHERLDAIARRRLVWMLWLVAAGMVGVALLQAPRVAMGLYALGAPPRWALSMASVGIVVLGLTLVGGLRLFFELRDFRSAMLLEDRRRKEREAALKELAPGPWQSDPRLDGFGRER